jgi:hypothetical protein
MPSYRSPRVPPVWICTSNDGPQLPAKKLLLGSRKQTRFIRVDAASRLAHPDVKALIDAAIDYAIVPLPSTAKGSLIIKRTRPVPRSNDRAEGRRNDGVKFPPSSSRKIGLYDLLAPSEGDIDMSGVEEIGQPSLKCVAGRYDESLSPVG